MNNKILNLRKLLNKRKLPCWNCWECCWVIIFSKDELKEMTKSLKKQWLHSPPNWKWNKYCEYLTSEWKCSVYNSRPIICRWFWQIDLDSLKCPKKVFSNLIVQPNEMKQYRTQVMKDWIMNKNADSILWSIDWIFNNI
jgi:Fe-S-cluster containining protein